jgi:hypothetical protein
MTTGPVVKTDILDITVRLERRDYIRAKQWALLKGRRVKVLFLAFGVVSLLMSFYAWTARRSNLPCPSKLAWPGFYLLFLPIGLLAGWLGNYFGTRHSWRIHKAIREEIHYVFSDRGVDATAPNLARRHHVLIASTWHVDWGNLYKMNETGHVFLLFVSKDQMLIIPKRSLSAEQTTSFRRVLESNVQSKLRLQRV